MSDQMAEEFNEGVKKTLTLRAGLSIFGSKFKARVPVTELDDGLYKITKEDWDNTIGPVFDRMRAGIHNKDKIDADRYRAIAHGYLAMQGDQTRQFHTLLSAFGCAANPERLKTYPGTVETNKYLRYYTEFTKTLNGPEQSVLINRTQLQALANIAKGAIEYSKEGKRVADSAKDFYEDYDEDRKDVKYSDGLINKIT